MSIIPLTPPLSIVGTVGGQNTTDEAPIAPFATASVVDSDPNSIDTLYISIIDAGPNPGTLSGAGELEGYASYAISGTASQITKQLQSIVYTPSGVYPGNPITAKFNLTATNLSPYGTMDRQTSVTDTSTQQAIVVDSNVNYDGNGVFSIYGRLNGDYQIQSLTFYRSFSYDEYPDFDVQKSDYIDVNGDSTFEIIDSVGSDHLATETSLRILSQAFNDFGSSQLNFQFSLTTGITGKRYTAEQEFYSEDGSAIISSTYFREDGSRAVNILSGGQTFESNYADTFLNRGAPESTFVFNPGFGLDIVRQFRVNGEDHDVLSLSGSDFHNSIAEVLRNTSNVGGAAVITDPTTGDAIRLAGISKAQLVHNQADFTFHA